MLNVLNEIKNISQNKNIRHQLLAGKFGIEKENVRVDTEGNLSLLPHPDCFGDKNVHPYITTDFSESQIEMITPPLDSVHEAFGMLETIHAVVTENIGDEMLWLQSMPPNLPAEEDIPIAVYGEKGGEKERYRNFLADTYGSNRLLISGVHFNFSFADSLLQQLMVPLGSAQDFESFREEIYLKTVRNFIRYRWLLVWLTGRSPVTADDLKVKSLRTDEPISINCKKSLSLRTCPQGYRNKEVLCPDYSSVGAWKESVQGFIAAGKLSCENELYAPIRVKFAADDVKISHLEVRIIDLDPFERIGVNEIDLHFVHLFLLFCLFTDESTEFTQQQQELVNKNQDTISCHGLGETVLLTDLDGSPISSSYWALKILGEMEQVLLPFESTQHHYYQQAMARARKLVENPEQHPARSLLKCSEEQGYIEFNLDRAKQAKKISLEKGYRFYGFEDMELSTQLLLKEAILQGIDFEILDRQENFVRLTKEGEDQYVMQATRTALDNYSSVLMMENKLVTKKILQQHGLRVPSGEHYVKSTDAFADYRLFEGKAIVVKPKSTNFGLGITIIKHNEDVSMFKKAVEIAFGYDDSILIENFEPGREFRFFVLNDEVVGILLRVPANVTGDGVHTIAALVGQKNGDPLRGKGYRTPLEKIELGEAEEMFLASQQIDFDYIPSRGEVVFLRENSNISTGGDSIDFTDDVHPSYKEIAVKAARALNVKITGLDMMIPDITVAASADNYAIIEMNFNPAIHIHCYPYRGKNRLLNQKVMAALWG